MSRDAAQYDDEAEPIDQVIGANVHTLMWRAGETQSAIAPIWGMTQSALSHKLRGKRPWYASEIDSAARRYGVTRDQLFTPDMRMPDYELAGSNVIPILSFLHHPNSHRPQSS